MPLRKHRSVDDVPSSSVMDEDDPAAALRMAFPLSELAPRLARWRLPSGVHKSRSPAEAQALRQAWERDS
jgi:hypothetical protein